MDSNKEVYPWLADLVTSLRDTTSKETWPIIYRRYTDILHGLPKLSEETNWRLTYACRAMILREARREVPTNETKVLEAVDEMLALFDSAALGRYYAHPTWSWITMRIVESVKGKRKMKKVSSLCVVLEATHEFQSVATALRTYAAGKKEVANHIANCIFTMLENALPVHF